MSSFGEINSISELDGSSFLALRPFDFPSRPFPFSANPCMASFYLALTNRDTYLQLLMRKNIPNRLRENCFFGETVFGISRFALKQRGKAKAFFLLFLQVADIALLDSGLSRFHMGVFNAIFMQNRCRLMILVAALNMGFFRGFPYSV